MLFAARALAATHSALRGNPGGAFLLVWPHGSLVFDHSHGALAARTARSAFLVRTRIPSAPPVEPRSARADQRRQPPGVLKTRPRRAITLRDVRPFAPPVKPSAGTRLITGSPRQDVPAE